MKAWRCLDCTREWGGEVAERDEKGRVIGQTVLGRSVTDHVVNKSHCVVAVQTNHQEKEQEHEPTPPLDRS